MKKIVLMVTILGASSFSSHAYLCDDAEFILTAAWNPWKENQERHTRVEVHNFIGDKVRIKYCRKHAGIEAILSRAQILKPGKKVNISVLKNKRLMYQHAAPCPEDCEQTGKHHHWADKIRMPVTEGQSIELKAMIQSASKQ